MRMRSLLGTALAACVGFAVVTAVTGDVARADEIDDSIAKLKAANKSGDEREAIKLLALLQNKTDARVGKAFTALTKSKHDKIAVAAYQKAAARKDPNLLKKLKVVLKLKDKKLYKERSTVMVAALKAAGEYGHKSLRDSLAKVVKKFMSTNSAYCSAAILSFGKERHVAVIEQLLKWGDQTASAGSGGQGGGSLSQDARDNYAKAGEAVYKALGDLTGEDMGDAPSWREWWDENEKGYEIPEPDKVGEPVDFTKLREHTDSYGYTVKLPEGEQWRLADPDEGIVGGRFKVVYTQKEEAMARAHWVIFNTRGQSIQTEPDFVKWWIEDWKKNQFDPETIKAEPEVMKMEIDGREFYWSKCKGQSAGRARKWGGAFRRVYVTKIRHLLMYVYLDIKTDVDAHLKQPTIDLVERMNFKKKGKKKKR